MTQRRWSEDEAFEAEMCALQVAECLESVSEVTTRLSVQLKRSADSVRCKIYRSRREYRSALHAIIDQGGCFGDDDNEQ